MAQTKNSVRRRIDRVRARDKRCTVLKADGIACGRETEHVHHWYRDGEMREREEHMQGVCDDCHVEAHRWAGDSFPPGWPSDKPYRLDHAGWRLPAV